MKVYFASDYYRRFADDFAGSHAGTLLGSASICRFPNQEMHIIVHDDVKNDKCLIIGSVAPPDEQLVTLLTLADALKRNGARSVQVLLPYLGYARQDKFQPGESGGIALIGSLLRSVGIDKVITIDAHSKLDRELIGLPFVSLSAASLFVPAIQNLGWGNASILAPDEGAINRCHGQVDALGSKQPVVYLIKRRADGITHLQLVGDVGARIIIVDDILDSGRTLVSACTLLRKQGVQDIAIVVTHGLFTGGAWKRLFGLGVKALFVSDSCPEAVRQKHQNVHAISLTPLLTAVWPAAVRKEQQYENAIT